MCEKRDWLISIRANLRMDHKDVAKKAGIGRSTYTLIENGQRRPSVEVAKAIATVLGFEWTKFFEDKKGA